MRRPPPIVTPAWWHPGGEAWVPGHPPMRVWGGIPGETCRVHVVGRGRNQVRARWAHANRPHADRVQPPCDRYNPCGGCAWMHLATEAQGRHRVGLVERALAEVGLERGVDGWVPAPAGTEGFRHLVKLVAGYSDRGRPRLGAPGRGDRRIVPVPGCLVVTEDLRRLTSEAAHQVIQLGVPPWQPGRGGLLRHLVARQSRATGEILVTLVATRWHRVLEELATALSVERLPVAGVHLHLNAGEGNAIYDRDAEGRIRTRRLWGAEVIEEEVAGVRVQVGPGDFFQTHPAMADRLVRDVLEALELRQGVPLVDLYCGVGPFTLAGAARTGWALGIEAAEGAVRRARAAASAARLEAEFDVGPVHERAALAARRLAGRRPAVVVNPARRGFEAGVVDRIEELAPRRLAVVSCNPRALARDLAALVARGFSIASLRAYDMFPHTPHVEVLALLLPPDGGDVPATVRSPRRRRIRG